MERVAQRKAEAEEKRRAAAQAAAERKAAAAEAASAAAQKKKAAKTQSGRAVVSAAASPRAAAREDSEEPSEKGLFGGLFGGGAPKMQTQTSRTQIIGQDRKTIRGSGTQVCSRCIPFPLVLPPSPPFFSLRVILSTYLFSFSPNASFLSSALLFILPSPRPLTLQ